MKKGSILLFFILLIININNVYAQEDTSFNCNYNITSDSLNSARAGKLTCTMGYDYGWFFNKAIYDCSWETSGSQTYAIESGTDSFDLAAYLKTGTTQCPKYVAVQTMDAYYAQTQIFQSGINVYFTNDYNDAIEQAKKGGTYYTVGDLAGFQDSELDDMKCQAIGKEYVESALKKMENEIQDFIGEGCDKFALTEYEKLNAPLVETYNKYENCKSKLTLANSYFNNFLTELKDGFNDYHCFTEEEYNKYFNKVSYYKEEYSKLKENLANSFNEKETVNNDDDKDKNESSSKEEIDYKITETSIAEICSKPEYRKPMRFIGKIVNFLKIIVPILIIGFGALDLFKAVTGAKDDEIKKSLKSIAVRIVAGVVIFLIPGIVQLVMNMVNEWSDYKNSWCCCTECLLNSDCDINSCNSNSCRIEGTN